MCQQNTPIHSYQSSHSAGPQLISSGVNCHKPHSQRSVALAPEETLTSAAGGVSLVGWVLSIYGEYFELFQCLEAQSDESWQRCWGECKNPMTTLDILKTVQTLNSQRNALYLWEYAQESSNCGYLWVAGMKIEVIFHCLLSYFLNLYHWICTMYLYTNIII